MERSFPTERSFSRERSFSSTSGADSGHVLFRLGHYISFIRTTGPVERLSKFNWISARPRSCGGSGAARTLSDPNCPGVFPVRLMGGMFRRPFPFFPFGWFWLFVSIDTGQASINKWKRSRFRKRSKKFVAVRLMVVALTGWDVVRLNRIIRFWLDSISHKIYTQIDG